MAQAKLNPVFDGFSHSIGNLTFFTRNGKTYTRRRRMPSGVKTTVQEAVRSGFSQDWETFPVIVPTAWNTNAKIYLGYSKDRGMRVGSLGGYSGGIVRQRHRSC